MTLLTNTCPFVGLQNKPPPTWTHCSMLCLGTLMRTAAILSTSLRHIQARSGLFSGGINCCVFWWFTADFWNCNQFRTWWFYQYCKEISFLYKKSTQQLQITKFLGSTWDPLGADVIQVGPILVPGTFIFQKYLHTYEHYSSYLKTNTWGKWLN